MDNKVIVTCALTGAGAITDRSTYVPITPAQIAQSAIEAASAGAAVVHIHVRHPETGAPSMDLTLYREVVERIRASNTDVIINLTGGVGGRYIPSDEDPALAGPDTNFVSPERRVEHIVELKPEVCSLDIGSLNLGPYTVLNTPSHLTRMAALVRSAGVKPELEVFDLGGIRYAKKMLEIGEIEGQPLFQLCLGISWGAGADTETMLAMRNMLPDNSLWSAFGISSAIWPMVAQAAVLGGNVRVGLEDSLFINKGELAKSNAVLVERAVSIVRNVGREIASPGEAREILKVVKH
jgi:uncharacterized protein (DUF849 family)